jgi:hypothetical protein
LKVVRETRRGHAQTPPLRGAAGIRPYMLAAVWIVCNVCCRTFSSWLVGNFASAVQESLCGPERQTSG